MSRKRRSGRYARRPLQPAENPPSWRWLTAPVFIAFSGGFLLSWFLFLGETGVTPGRLTTLMYWVMIVVFAISWSHISSQLVRRWMIKRARRADAARSGQPQPAKKS